MMKDLKNVCSGDLYHSFYICYYMDLLWFSYGCYYKCTDIVRSLDYICNELMGKFKEIKTDARIKDLYTRRSS